MLVQARRDKADFQVNRETFRRIVNNEAYARNPGYRLGYELEQLRREIPATQQNWQQLR